MGFLLRWFFAFVLLSATFNPTSWNYIAWTRANGSDSMSLAVLLGLLLMVGYIVYLRATIRSIGAFGMILIAGIVSSSLWVAADFGVISLDDPDLNTWIAIFALSVVLGIGLSWSLVRRRLSGQADVDDVED